MDMISPNNYVKLCGVMAGRPVYSHSSRGQQFYTPLRCCVFRATATPST